MKKATFLASALLMAMLAVSGCKADSKSSTNDQKEEMAMTQNVTELIKKYRDWETDRKSTRLNSSHLKLSRMPSSA